IQLSKLFSSAPSHPVGDHDRLRLWARFFMATEDAQLDQLAAEDPIMAVAVKTLDELSQDPEIYHQARTRREEKILYQMDLSASRSEGLQEGERKGKREMLLEQLEQRFGPLPPTTRAQIDAAASEQLRAWARRVLTANNLEEVIAA
ncbi:MAG: DUF4351 domain-containing protein, partial [Myxococcota bacterium]